MKKEKMRIGISWERRVPGYERCEGTREQGRGSVLPGHGEAREQLHFAWELALLCLPSSLAVAMI